jgi:hypothetical protein
VWIFPPPIATLVAAVPFPTTSDPVNEFVADVESTIRETPVTITFVASSNILPVESVVAPVNLAT